MVTVTISIYVTAGNWTILNVRVCSYSVFYVLYIPFSTYNTEWYLKKKRFSFDNQNKGVQIFLKWNLHRSLSYASINALDPINSQFRQFKHFQNPGVETLSRIVISTSTWTFHWSLAVCTILESNIQIQEIIWEDQERDWLHIWVSKPM